ncbi:M1 family metallopeptidase [Sphingomonas rhizophila]|uniref:Aminopeptidase n=1 Tax=Sphingomonas rhizophila TaxID=2071607 RepID=A0A7G9S9G6_9SPHN|nr:M1 family metallopeptidase [Sphingomonas rhizophila]QNN64491.1 M1 family metallopeptidase [Sphingomonas rhizophila]
MRLPVRPALFAATATLALAIGGCTTAGTPLAINGGPAPEAVAAVPVDTVDTTVPTQLPRVAVPRHYALSVTPNAAAMTFAGDVRIDMEVIQPTNSVTLNAADLAVGSASISGSDGNQPATIRADAKAQTVTLGFAQPLQPGKYSLQVGYTGKINEQANGLFALDYKDVAGADKRAIFTQFEPADARRFVPSFDEPDYKATWDLTATVPAGQMAVSNMPARSTEKLADGRERVTFATSPQMSTYLLFFAAGEFGRITKMAGNTEVGIVMSKGNEAKAQTALDAEAQLLPYFNDYFGVPYPLPKLDNVAGPGQSQFFGAMENWGAIFTFERILLDDPAVTTEGERQAIFGVEAHEMAHQWFGDLVTMAWWDDLWLNEGFASWMATKATKHFHPDWGAEFATIGSREAAMSQDALVTTHPIVQTVRTVEQANQAFDGITYSKGQSVITMLEAFAGEDVWQRGIQAYMQQHKYRNTRTDDLWRAVEQAGATGLVQIARDYTLQPGVPLIRVENATCNGGQTMLQLAQDEFSLDRKPGSYQPLSWHIPVRATVVGGQSAAIVTSGRTAAMTVPGCGPVIVNDGGAGYFRTLYRPADIEALRARFATLSPLNQHSLIEDQGTLSYAGYQNMGVALDLVDAIPANAHPEVLGDGLSTLGGLYTLFDGDAKTQSRIADILRARYSPVLDQIGFVPDKSEAPTIATLRPQLIGVLGNVGDPKVAAEARRMFGLMQTNPSAVPGSLKSAWLSQIARDADARTWDQIRAMAKTARSSVERQNLYSRLGAAKDKALAKRALDLALTDEPGKTVSAGIITAVAGRHPEMTLDYVIANWARVSQLVDSTSQSRFIARLAAASKKQATIDKLNRYAAANIAASDRKPIDQTINVIKVRLATEPRLMAETKAWLAARKK